MAPVQFDPFGERLSEQSLHQGAKPAAKWLLLAGSGLFWALAAAIVVARSIYFQPGVYESFNRVALSLRHLLG